ncbi:MAG: A/G-specific adenine glycosylase [Cellvibrionaceae bacterium]
MATFHFSHTVLQWFDKNGRKNLPWQHNITAYRVWLSEIMLQQTQVKTVIPYFHSFTEKFPTIEQLAQAPIDDVLHLWTGLGYYARARNLHACAKKIVEEYNGDFPQDVEALVELPGIGRSTAGAICSIVWDKPTAILDGNVKRVLARFKAISGWPGQTAVANRLWTLAESLTPDTHTGNYTQAMMDLGATVCTRSKPKCEECPLATQCVGFSQRNPTDYPGKKPKKTIPVRAVKMLMIQNPDGEFFLEQRPSQGIWGGLWSFLEIPIEQDSLEHCFDQLGYTAKDIKPNAPQIWDTYRHTFSHYHLDITPVLIPLTRHSHQIMADDSRIWYNTASPQQVGLAAPVKKLLFQAASADKAI